MSEIVRHPFVVFVLSFLAMWISAWVGLSLRERKLKLDEGLHRDLDLIVSATLTLLGLIIGFSFSMAISRYDQRKSYEEAEANAIGTEYVRAELLPAADATNVHSLLKSYLNERILFYVTRDSEELRRIDTKTAQLQTELWSAVQSPAMAQPNPLSALVLSGMNDVLNSQGYTQAAWWNRIPPGAWWLMAAVAICANLLIGYDSRLAGQRAIRLLILPFILCIAFFAIADIDSPRRGVIRVNPQNLMSLAQSLQGQ
jgi:small-conductance mechanosensitive channel